METKKTQESDFDYKTIKTYEDACKKLGIAPGAVPVVISLDADTAEAILAYYCLIIIFRAINNGWKPNWNDQNQYKYFPWFRVKATAALSSGFGFGHSYYNCTATHSAVGSRLCTDSAEKALYIACQFEKEYKKFLLFTSKS